MRVHASVLLVILVVGALLPPVRAAWADDLAVDPAEALRLARDVERDVVGTVARVRGAAVAVVGRVDQDDVPGARLQRPRPLNGVGSGVVISWRGVWVLTNEHVVNGEQRVEAIAADGKSYPLRVRATSRSLDLALLSFETVPDAVSPVELELAPLPDIREGTWAVATGNPFFLGIDGVTVATLGVVSGTRPPDPTAYLNAPTLQHDAEINPGSSGGALWSLDGHLLGINGTIATRIRRDGGGPAHTGASFSVPVTAVRDFLESTLGSGRVARSDVPRRVAPGLLVPRLPAEPSPKREGRGIRFRTGHDAAGRPAGALVGQIVGTDPGAPPTPGTALRAGDLITQATVGGRTYLIRSGGDMDRLLAAQSSGSTLTLHYQRAGRSLLWTGRLGGR